MQTSRFQLALMVALATGLGASIASSDAIGYPAGASVSLGANPIRSASGHWDLTGPTYSEGSVLSAPSDQDLIVTEAVVGLTQNNASCWAVGRFVVNAGTETIATIPVHNAHLDYAQVQPVVLSFQSGIPVPAGTSVDVEWNFVTHNCGMTSYDLSWVLSGYLASP